VRVFIVDYTIKARMGALISRDGLPCEGLIYAPPIPARTWTRYGGNCGTHMGFTQEQLDMRRKVEILQYQGLPAKKGGSVNGRITKVQRYVNAVNGKYLPNRTFTTQSETVTAPNTADLQLGCGPSSVPGECFVLEYSPQSSAVTTDCLPPPESTTASDVPGPPMMLQLDPNVPVTNLALQKTYPGQSIDNLPAGP